MPVKIEFRRCFFHLEHFPVHAYSVCHREIIIASFCVAPFYPSLKLIFTAVNGNRGKIGSDVRSEA